MGMNDHEAGIISSSSEQLISSIISSIKWLSDIHKITPSLLSDLGPMWMFKSLDPGRCNNNFKNVIFQLGI